jgi:hypothetical protein
LPSGFAWLDASSWFRAPTAGNGHETAADGVVPDNRRRFPVQLGELLAQLPRARNAATKLCASHERHGVRRGQRIEGADRRSLVAAAETYGFALAEGASKRMAEHFEAKRNAVLSYNR